MSSFHHSVWCCRASCDWKRTLQAFLLRVAGKTGLRRLWHSFLCLLATPDMVDSQHCFTQEGSILHRKHQLSLSPLPMLCPCSGYRQGRFCNFLAPPGTRCLLTPSSMHLHHTTNSVLVTKTGHDPFFLGCAAYPQTRTGTHAPGYHFLNFEVMLALY